MATSYCISFDHVLRQVDISARNKVGCEIDTLGRVRVSILDMDLATTLCTYAASVCSKKEEKFDDLWYDPDNKKQPFEVALGVTHLREDGEEFQIVRLRAGEPLGTRDGAMYMIDTYVCGKSRAAIHNLIKHATTYSSRSHDPSHYKLLTWMRYDWRTNSDIRKREFSSVILDAGMKEDLISDVMDFVSEKTREWYSTHHVPYRRGYMFYGPPGTGKTSIITAIASMLDCQLCRVQLAMPHMHNASLLDAVNSAPERSILLFEDIDSLFGECTTTDDENVKTTSEVTLSGLLNALDGMTDNKRGLIFMFTTNHINKLQRSLIRPGRVDRMFHVTYATRSQMKAMFLRFYPDDEKAADTFCYLNSSAQLTTATLQEHFVRCRTLSAEAAAVRLDFLRIEDDSLAPGQMMYT